MGRWVSKRERELAVSAERVLAWVRHVKQRPAAAAAPVAAPVPLERGDAVMLDELKAMLRQGLALERIKPCALRRRLQEPWSVVQKQARGGREARAGGGGGNGAAGGLEQVLTEEELAAGGEYLYSDREVQRREEQLKHVQEVPQGGKTSKGNNRSRPGTPRVRAGGGGGRGGSGKELEGMNGAKQSSKVDYARLQELLAREEL